jgi:hypothetical protein
VNGDKIIKYAGAPVRFTGNDPELVPAALATGFINTAEAWLKIRAAKLPPSQIIVADREEELAR